MEWGVWPKRLLTSQDRRQIVAEVLALAVGAFFETHVYTSRGACYKQVEGSPIGPNGPKCVVPSTQTPTRKADMI